MDGLLTQLLVILVVVLLSVVVVLLSVVVVPLEVLRELLLDLLLLLKKVEALVVEAPVVVLVAQLPQVPSMSDLVPQLVAEVSESSLLVLLSLQLEQNLEFGIKFLLLFLVGLAQHI
jgi:hypothetical protein